jgi:drug/metabolite transporter (DMT)-like permease
MAAGPSSDAQTMLLRAAPALFVLLWSTGWISARAAAPYADPLTFLTVRFALAAVVLLPLVLIMRARWPARPADYWHLIVTGALIHAIYLGGVWYAVRHGVPTAISGLIAAIQPILTAMLAPVLLSERISPRQWAGVALGFAGIALTLSPGLSALAGDALTENVAALAINVVGMISVTLGTFYQKRFIASGDLRTVTLIQYIAAAAIMLPVAALLEPMRLEWNPQTIATMAWSVIGLSLGAIGLYLMLIRHGAVSRAAMLIYLVPPAVAIEAYVLFGETLGPVQWIGIAVTAVGVALAVRKAAR